LSPCKTGQHEQAGERLHRPAEPAAGRHGSAAASGHRGRFGAGLTSFEDRFWGGHDDFEITISEVGISRKLFQGPFFQKIILSEIMVSEILDHWKFSALLHFGW
jgi:hypothetical protein